jgi:hypothetical protein
LWSRVSSSTSFTSTVPTPQPTADVPPPQPSADVPTPQPTTLLYTNNPTIVHHNPKEKPKPNTKIMIKGGKSSNLNLINSLKEKVFLYKKGKYILCKC